MSDSSAIEPSEEFIEAQYKLITDNLMPFTVAVLALRRDDRTPRGIVAGGTGCLIEIDSTRFLLTAKHVVDGFTNPELLGVMSGHSPYPQNITDWNLIDQHSGIDVATIEIPTSFNPASIGKVFHKPDAWPPPRAQREELAVFLGIPGLHRQTGTNSITKHVTPFVDFVSSSSTRHFIMACEGERQVKKFNKNLPDFGPTGGVSGASVFINREGKLILSGIVYEGDETEKATFFAAHADFVRADGTIDRDKIPF